MDVRVGLWRKLSAKELMLLNCGVGEDSWEPVHSKGDQPWVFFEGMMLKLKLQYFGHLMQRVDSLEKTDAGRDWGQEEKGTTEDEMAGWHHRLDGHVWVNSGRWWWTGGPGMLRFMGSQRVRHDWVTEHLDLFPQKKDNFTFCYFKNKNVKKKAKQEFFSSNVLFWI